MKSCRCGAPSDDDAMYCGACGRRFPDIPIRSARWLKKMCSECLRLYPASAQFCDACGRPLTLVPEKKRRLTFSDSSGRTVTLEGRGREFGRADFAGWFPPEQAQLISRAQFRIVLSGPDFVIEHVSTANPTVVNGRDLNRPHRLETGDVIDLALGAMRVVVAIQ